MIRFGLTLGDQKPMPPPVLSHIRIDVQGKLSSYTRGGQFFLYPDASTTPLVYGTDFTLTEFDNIAYSASNRDNFLSGLNPSADIVPTNQGGYMIIYFTNPALLQLDRLTIQGRTTASSTYFKFRVYDDHGHVLWSRGSQAVRDMETWDIGLDLS